MPEQTNQVTSQLISPDERNEITQQLRNEVQRIVTNLSNNDGHLVSIEQGSIILNVCFKNRSALEKFHRATLSGTLAADLARILITKEMEEQSGCKLGISVNCPEQSFRNALIESGN